MQGEKGRVVGGAESKAQLPLKRRRQVYQQIILKRWCDQGDAHRNPRRSKSTWHRNGRQIEEIDEIRVQSQTGVQTYRFSFYSIDAVDRGRRRHY
jgi:hypothetical protein